MCICVHKEAVTSFIKFLSMAKRSHKGEKLDDLCYSGSVPCLAGEQLDERTSPMIGIILLYSVLNPQINDISSRNQLDSNNIF